MGARRARARAGRRPSAAASATSRLGRPAAAHRDDDDVAVVREQARDVAGDRRLADALAGPDHGERRQLERLELAAARSGSRRPRTASPRASTRLASRNRSRGPSTGSSERSTTTSGSYRASASSRSSRERHAVVLAARELLGAADEHARRRRRTAARRARRARPARSARRRSAPAPRSPRSSPRPRSAPCTSRTRASRSRTG